MTNAECVCVLRMCWIVERWPDDRTKRNDWWIIYIYISSNRVWVSSGLTAPNIPSFSLRGVIKVHFIIQLPVKCIFLLSFVGHRGTQQALGSVVAMVAQVKSGERQEWIRKTEFSSGVWPRFIHGSWCPNLHAISNAIAVGQNEIWSKDSDGVTRTCDAW